MAKNTKQARQEAERKRAKYYDSYMSRLCMLFNNAVDIEGDFEVPKRYLLRVLRNKGGIAYDRETGLYLPYVESGIDVYGLPTKYILIGYNGLNLERSPEQVVPLRANDLKYPIVNYFQQQIDKLVEFDLAIEQNLEANKTQTIVQVTDESQLLTQANEVEARRLGASVIYKKKTAGLENDLVVENTGAQYLIDKLLEARTSVLNETLSTIGISVANTEKRERVQAIEVLASQGYALDCINTLVDTFNYDAEYGGIPIRLKAKTSLVKQNEIELQQKEGDLE